MKHTIKGCLPYLSVSTMIVLRGGYWRRGRYWSCLLLLVASFFVCFSHILLAFNFLLTLRLYLLCSDLVWLADCLCRFFGALQEGFFIFLQLFYLLWKVWDWFQVDLQHWCPFQKPHQDSKETSSKGEVTQKCSHLLQRASIGEEISGSWGILKGEL